VRQRYTTCRGGGWDACSAARLAAELHGCFGWDVVGLQQWRKSISWPRPAPPPPYLDPNPQATSPALKLQPKLVTCTFYLHLHPEPYTLNPTP